MCTGARRRSLGLPTGELAAPHRRRGCVGPVTKKEPLEQYERSGLNVKNLQVNQAFSGTV
jgi:hypothetical protein